MYLVDFIYLRYKECRHIPGAQVEKELVGEGGLHQEKEGNFQYDFSGQFHQQIITFGLLYSGTIKFRILTMSYEA